MGYLIDTHAHLDMYEDWQEVIDDALKNGVERIIIPSVELQYFEKVKDIAHSAENVYYMLGIFPSEAQKWSDDIISDIKKYSGDDKLVGIGEIGLDYYWDKSFVDEQKEVFKKQILLANELKLPIAVHDRDAHKDCFDLLKEYNNGSDVIFHCFSGSVEFANEVIKEGWYIALGGVVTFKNAVKAKEVAKNIPLERLMLETDSPYLTPVPYRGKENRPSYVRFVADEIANLRGIEVDELKNITSQNAEKVFRLKAVRY